MRIQKVWAQYLRPPVPRRVRAATATLAHFVNGRLIPEVAIYPCDHELNGPMYYNTAEDGQPAIAACECVRYQVGLLGLRIFEATNSNIADLGEEHSHRVLRVCGKGTKVALIPLPPAVGRAIDRAIGGRSPRTTMRYDRARHNLDRHPDYVLAAFMASGT